MRAQVRRRPTPRKDETSIIEAMQDFIRYMMEERQASPFTLDAYERDLLRFVSERERARLDSTLASVSSEDIRGHMRALLDRRLSKASVRRAMYALGSFFGWAQRWGLVSVNPVARVTVPPKEPVREVRALSKRERVLLVATADQLAKNSRRPLDRHVPALIRLMLKTGLRRSEVLGLKWRDLDLKRGELLVRYGKGRKSRRVPVEDRDLLDLLGRIRTARDVGSNGFLW